MNEQHPLDELLKRKLAEPVHEASAADWAAAEALLGRRRRRRKGLWLWLAAAPLLLAGMLWQALLRQDAAPGTAPVQAAPPAWAATADSLCPPEPLPAARRMSRALPQRQSARKAAAGAPAAQPERMEDRPAGADALASGPGPASKDGSAAPAPVRRTSGLSRLAARRAALPPAGAMLPAPLPSGWKQQRHLFALHTGLSLAPGWQNLGTRAQPLSAHTMIGLRYAFQLTPRLRLQTGLMYQGRGGLDADTTVRSTEFGFGFESEVTEVSPRRMHWAELPLQADLRLAGRHYLLAGGYAAWLADVSGVRSLRLASDFGETPLSRAPAWGYRQGFRRWDAGLLLGYGYYLGDGMRLTGQMQYGLPDLTPGSYFRNTRYHRSIGFRLGLEIELTRL
jgi:hypothetical protein